ncbi:hypothetical protein D7W81_02460 [Corallococcus aberystwythensis]|uniref:Lipoprotein n=2 Tax=Corallococcus aberystwythensis TaxID=2316722 RepID=A0A3A8R014_9BACT|nr:hypothetical protein D7W81_02460 [Corallococcus aberystwythensis]
MFMGRLLTATMLGVFAGCQAEPSQGSAPGATEQEVAAARNCVQRFPGVTHCATGNATLKSTERGLEATGLTQLGQDGVVGAVGHAEAWRQKAVIDLGAGNEGVTYYGRNADQVISTITLAPEPGVPGGMRLLPTFTGSPGGSAYSITVRDHGQPVAMMLPHRWWEMTSVQIWAYLDRERHPDWYFFRVVGGGTGEGTEGACGWRVRFQEGAFQVTLEDGRQVTGDEIEFVEQLADGAYPYSSFTHIGMTGAVDKVTVLEEVVTLNTK